MAWKFFTANRNVCVHKEREFFRMSEGKRIIQVHHNFRGLGNFYAFNYRKICVCVRLIIYGLVYDPISRKFTHISQQKRFNELEMSLRGKFSTHFQHANEYFFLSIFHCLSYRADKAHTECETMGI